MKWTTEKLKKLKDIFEISNAKQLKEAFPGCSDAAIRNAAKYYFNLSHKRLYNDFTLEEVEKLKKLYSTTEDWEILLKEFPDKNKKQIQTVLRGSGLRKARIKNYPSNCNDEFFDEFKQEQAYILGFMEADGYRRPTDTERSFHLQFHLSDEDEEHLNNLKIKLGITTEIRHNKNPTSKDHDSVMLTCSSRGWTDKLNPHFRIGKIPDFIKENSKLLRHYIRGYFDGDGSIYQGKQAPKCNRINIVFSSESLAKDFMDTIVNKLGLKGKIKINVKSNSDRCWYFQINRQDEIKKFYYWIYKDSTLFLKRKKNRFIMDLDI